MTQLEQRVRQCELDVREKESRLKEARAHFEAIATKGRIDVEMARADLNKAEIGTVAAYEKAKQELERAQIDVDREKSCLELAQADLARGFES